MNQTIKDRISTLFQSAGEEYRKTPIQFLGALGALIFLLSQLILNLYTKVAFLDRITQIFDIKIETNLPAIGMAICVLVWSFVVILKQSKPNNKIEFIKYGHVAWKVTYNENGFEVDFPSYCPNHQIQHVEDNNGKYLCPACGFDNVPYPREYPNEINSLHDAVESIIRAKHSKHLIAK